MPPFEINQIRHISACVRLDESTAEQVDQSAAFIHASADDVEDKALNYVFSKERDFQEFLETPQTNHVASTLRVRKGPNKDTPERAQKSLQPGWSRRLPCRYRRHDRAFNSVPMQERCFASG